MNYAISIIALMFVFLSGCATPKQIESSYHRPLTDKEAFLIYESRSAQPLSDDELARMCLKYDKPKDEFEEREKLAFHKGKIAKYFNTLKKSDNLLVFHHEQIAEYDFDKQGFPLNINDDMYYTYDNGYALKFTNAGKASFLPVPQAKAKEISKQFRGKEYGRNCYMKIKSHIVGVEPGTISGKPYKIIQAKIHEVEVNACPKNDLQIYENCTIPLGTISIDIDEVNYLKNW